MQELKKYIESDPIRWILYILGGLIGLSLIFEAGLLAGYRRGELRYRNTTHGTQFMFAPFSMPGAPHVLLTGGHGAVGTITTLSLPMLTLSLRDGSTRIIALSPTTTVRDNLGNASSSDLSEGETVVVIGVPEANGSIDAELIRVLQIPSQSTSTAQ